ncbi:MAG: hypothetical protein CMJ75_08905 [Planctomycetaceae bacterium]|nr:hypothetical protein [Planctomycetaceae bacterium]
MFHSPNGTKLASGGFDRTVKFWNAATGQELLTLKGNNDDERVWGVCFSPDGTQLAASNDNMVMLRISVSSC